MIFEMSAFDVELMTVSIRKLYYVEPFLKKIYLIRFPLSTSVTLV